MSRSPRRDSLRTRAPRSRSSDISSHRVLSVSAFPYASEVQTVDLNLIDQGRPRNTELDRRPRAIAAVMPQCALDVLPLDLRERLRLIAPVSRGALAQIRREVLDPDVRLATRQDHRALEHVAHLPDVAGPRRRQQPLQDVGAAVAGAAGQDRK